MHINVVMCHTNVIWFMYGGLLAFSFLLLKYAANHNESKCNIKSFGGGGVMFSVYLSITMEKICVSPQKKKLFPQ